MTPAQKKALDELRRQNRLHVDDVINAARDVRSPLHSAFTWNKQKGFEMNLRREARDLIGEYEVVLETSEGRTMRTRYYVSLSSDRQAGGGYRTITDVLSDEEMRSRLISDALAELEGARAKYGTLSELAQVFAAIDQVRDKQEEQQRKRKRKVAA